MHRILLQLGKDIGDKPHKLCSFSCQSFYPVHPVYPYKTVLDIFDPIKIIFLDKTGVNIEVKAGKSGSMRSLHQFILHKKSPRAIRLDTNPASRQNIQLKTKNGDEFSEISFE